MDKKKLIFCYVIQILSIVVLGIMLMPIIKVSSHTLTPMELVLKVNDWYYMEEYLFGIAALITLITAPLLVISLELCKLSACGVINSKLMDKILYIVNIVLVAFIVGVSVNYFLGLGRTIGKSGLQLFKGSTYFEFATAFFYLHVAISIAMLVVAILNRKGKKA